MSAQAVLKEARPYLEELEQRLELAVARHPGLVEAVGRSAIAAGGKRLRPLLVHLTGTDRESALTAGVAIELVHVATLVHDDLIDGAKLRRGPAATISSRAHSTSSPRAETSRESASWRELADRSPGERRCSSARRT